MSTPPHGKSWHVQARSQRDVHSDAMPAKMSGVTPGTVHGRSCSLPPHPMAQGSVEPLIIGNLTDKVLWSTSCEVCRRQLIWSWIPGNHSSPPATDKPSGGGKPLVLVYPQYGRTWRKPTTSVNKWGTSKWCCGLHSHKGLSSSQGRDASPHSIGTTYPPVTVSSTGGGVHNSDGSSPSSDGGGQLDQQFPEVAGQQAKARPLRQCRQAILMPKSAWQDGVTRCLQEVHLDCPASERVGGRAAPSHRPGGGTPNPIVWLLFFIYSQ